MDKQSIREVVLLAISVCMVVVVSAKVKVPAVLGEGAVLQQESEVKVWGWADAGSTVVISTSWSADKISAKAASDGTWSARITTPAASYERQTMTLSDGEETVISDILIGEVWLAAGQSNMEMPLKGFPGCCVENGLDDAIEAASLQGVRMFTVPRRHAYSPIYNCEGQWKGTSRFEDVLEFSATAFYFAENLSKALHVPVGIINCSYGGTKVESWLPKEILQTYPDVLTDSAEIVSTLPDYERAMAPYYGMFCAVKSYTVKGMIWYQGCSNVWNYEVYADRITTMVAHWREQMECGEMPFYFVQIAPYEYGTTDGIQAARLREQQFMSLSTIPNSGMVSTNDTVEPYERYNIHPRNKSIVGHRLSWMALNKTYGYKEICCEGPRYSGWTVKGNEAWVAFDNLQMGICRNYDLQGFELAGEDHIFHPADSVWLHWQTNEIVVSAKAVTTPIAVRYCFRDWQSGTLKGGNEQPALPFRTDNW